jgi:glycosyltransferase involved in cell wall biosynthesis
MQILFVHQNFPAQFGAIAAYLVAQKGFRCIFLSQNMPGKVSGIECLRYRVRGGARPITHFCSRGFENATWQSHAVYEFLKSRPDIRPDLIVGHSGYLSTLFLRDLYDCPIINYFEYFYHLKNSDLDFRPDFPPTALNRLCALARNAVLLLDLENCDRGYSPTRWQRDRLPGFFHDKVRVIFDGIDTNLWHPGARPPGPRRLGLYHFPPGVRLVTYVARGLESMRGFDIFMRMAKKLCERRPDVLFLIAGQDRVFYGGDERATGQMSFKEWVLSQDNYDLSRFLFLGILSPVQLAQLFCLSDLHVYLTVPFVLSWSLMNALACGATVLASDTPPVREMIEHGRNGLLANFFDVEGMVEQAERVLNAPEDTKHLGVAGVEMIRQKYGLEVCLPQMLALYEEAQALRRDA